MQAEHVMKQMSDHMKVECNEWQSILRKRATCSAFQRAADASTSSTCAQSIADNPRESVRFYLT